MADIRLIIAGSRGCNPTDEVITAEVARLPVDWGADGPTPEAMRRMIVEVLCGDAPGSDRAGARWAAAMGIPVHHEPITEDDIRKWGRYLGPKQRNRRLAERGSHAICFWDGMSGGTPDLAIRMVIRGKHVQAAPCKRERRARGSNRVGAGRGKSEPPPPAVDDSRAPAA